MSKSFGLSGLSTDGNGNIIVENNLILNGGMIMPPAININLTGNTNNLVITGLLNGVLIRISSSGNYNLTGLVPPDIAQGGLIFISNIGTNSITLKNNSALSSETNRFLMGADKKLQDDESAIFVYDTLNLRYRMFSVNI